MGFCCREVVACFAPAAVGADYEIKSLSRGLVDEVESAGLFDVV